MIEQLRTKQVKDKQRSRSRSRSRDNENRIQKFKSIILKEAEDLGNSTHWAVKDQQLLEQLLAEKLNDQQLPIQFKSRRTKKYCSFDGKPQLTYEQYLIKQEEFHNQQELVRTFFRMQQGRQLPVDKFIKIAYIYKGKLKLEKNSLIVRTMRNLRQAVEELSVEELRATIPEIQIHAKVDIRNKTQLADYWDALMELIEEEIERKSGEQEVMKPEIQQRIDVIMNKQLEELLKTERSILAVKKQSSSYNENSRFWDNILKRIKVKKNENILVEYYYRFKQSYQEQNENHNEQEQRVNTSPILQPRDIVSVKFLVTEQQQIAERAKLAERIFKQDFEKSRQKLEDNLSLPRNHNLLEQTIITDVNTTYDYIAEEILEFERYKRLEEDEEDFNDWLPIQTEGRFRDRRPVYVNRVRMSFQWNRYNQLHYDSQNPPPKTVQGYKFNIFYPHLLDKTKTPQYYLEPTQTTDYAIIKFKAGPPYLDIAFKIVSRQWDFSEKSGFQSIFAKGILHLYFNFKKPRYRI